MDTRQNVEYKMVSEFISKTGANPDDALACLKTWGWDMKRALTDYNDTCAVDLIDLIDEDVDNSKESVVVLRNNSSSLNNKYKLQQQQQQQQQQQYQEINKTTAPVLCKQDSIDLTECKKLFRGISRATDNVGIVSRARHEIAKDFYKSLKRNDNTNNFQYLVDTPDSTFILPNIYNYPEDFRIFIEKDLIEMSTLNALEQSQRLNWWADSNVCRKLWPLATTGDGNCLLHAASLGIWGFHDRKLTLRTALYSVLSDGKFKDELRRRWRFQQTQFNKRAGFVYSESEWSKEWDDIISMASPEPRKSINNHNYNNPTTTTAATTTRNNDDYRRRISFLGRNSITENEVLDNNLSTSSPSTTAATTAAVYESLEEIHILALAHVLRRAIIVISDTVLKDLHGEAMAPITFGGIYLPFEIEPKECNRGPLLLAYDMAHFSALVPMENGSDYPPALVPLTDYENILLPIQFCIDPGEDFDWKLYNGNEDNWSLTEREHIALLKEYLDVVYVATNRSPDDEICEDIEDEFEKKFIESEIIIPTSADYITTNTSEEANNNNNCNGKSKASRQLHSVAKQFGSIGKNMSRKLKKNIGSIAKLGGKNFQKKNSFTGMGGTSLSPPYICSRILCARLRLKRHEYQEEMIRNYLECAQNRFIEVEKNKEQKLLSSTGNITGTTIQQQQQQQQQSTVVAINTGINTLNKDECSNNGSNRNNDRSKLDSLSITQNDNNMSILQQQEFNEHSYCINAGCNQLATFETSYLCPECFEKQKKHENLQYFNSSPRYGTGNSKFYTQADIQSHDSIRKLPSLKKLNELDQTLYLSNSTFYNDVLPSYDEVEHLNNRESHRKYTTSVSSSSHQPLSASSSSSSSSTTTPSPSQSQSSNGSNNNAINNKKFLSAENNSLSLSPISITKIHISNDDNDDIERNRKNNLHQHLHLQQQQQQPYNNHQLIVTGITSSPSIPITKPCKTLGCPFYGNSSTNFLCSKCLKATIESTITTPRNQQDYDYYQHHKNHNHNHSHHSHHNESSFKSNPIYKAPTTPQPPTSATSTTTLYKSESKITSDI